MENLTGNGPFLDESLYYPIDRPLDGDDEVRDIPLGHGAVVTPVSCGDRIAGLSASKCSAGRTDGKGEHQASKQDHSEASQQQEAAQNDSYEISTAFTVKQLMNISALQFLTYFYVGIQRSASRAP